jgi:hypothetical protein
LSEYCGGDDGVTIVSVALVECSEYHFLDSSIFTVGLLLIVLYRSYRC